MNEIISKIGLSGNLSRDVSLLIIIGLLSLFFALVIGRQKLVSVLLSIYIAMAVVSVLPGDFMPNTSYKPILFIVLVALFAISGKRFLSGNLSLGSKIWKLFIFSFLEIGLILSVIFSIIPKSMALDYVSSTAHGYFVSGWFPFIWLVAPLIFLFIFCRRRYQS